MRPAAFSTFIRGSDMRLGGLATLVGMAVVLGAAPVAAQARPAAKPTAGAQAPTSGTKVAFLNFRAALQAAPGYIQAESTFTKEVEGFRGEIAKLQATVDSAASDFETQSALLNATQRQAKRNELTTKQQAAEQKTQELQQKAQERERALLDPIQQKVNAAIEAVRAEGGYAMIFDVSAPSSTILAADRGLDVTQRVVAKVKGS